MSSCQPLAKATVDRLLPLSDVDLIAGSSHRRAEAAAGTGVLPLG